jgi:hypothetical protein
MRTILYSLCILLLVGCAHNWVKEDVAMAAIDGGDATVIIEGCGAQPIVGYTYCRVREGDAASSKLSIIAPPAQCKEKQCVFYKIFYPTGEPAVGGAIDKGVARVDVPWKMLLGRDQFGKSDRGFWPVLLEVHWIDEAGHDRKSFAEGEIRLRVMAREYQALNAISNDSNFVWSWIEGTHIFKMTTGMRAFAGPVEGRPGD